MSTEPTRAESVSAGLDQLWKFQLRRENKELLSIMTSLRDRLSENQRDTSRRLDEAQHDAAQLAMRIKNSHVEMESHRQQVESMSKEVAAIKASLLAQKSSSDAIAAERVHDTHTMSADAVDQLSPIRETILPAKRPRKQPTTLLTKSRQGPIVPSAITRPKRVSARGSKAKKQPTRGAVSKSQLDTSTTLSTGLPIEEEPEEIIFPRLIQGRNQSLQDYLKVASAMQVNFPPEMEAPFVAHFCKGLASTQDRSKVHEALRAKGQETVSSDGTVIFRCNWHQLHEIMAGVELPEMQPESVQV